MAVGSRLNSLFTYNTPRYVVIRDWRLGLLHKCLLVAVALYVLLYQFLYKKAAFQTETPVCSVGYQLKRPTPGDPLDWWKASDADRVNMASDLPPATALPYCNETTLPAPSRAQKIKPCQFFDADTIAPGTLRGDTSILISTRFSITSEAPECRVPTAANNFTCDHLYEERSQGVDENVFVAGIEDYQLLVDHQAVSANLATQISAKSKDIQGAVLHSGVDSKKSWTPVTQESSSGGGGGGGGVAGGYTSVYGYDVFTIRQLLEAAGVDDLDALKASTLRGAPASYRYEGVTIYLQVDYTNMYGYGFGTSPPTYSYKALLMSTYKPSHQALEPTYYKNRTILNRHGITIVAQCVGEFGEFNFFTLFTMLASASAMIAVASLVVNYISLLICPMKKFFKSAKYRETDDFDDLRAFYAGLDESDRAKIRTLDHLESEHHRASRTEDGAGGRGSAGGSGNNLEQSLLGGR